MRKTSSMTRLCLVVSFVFAAAAAQSLTTITPTPIVSTISASSKPQATFTVSVGKGDNSFSPNVIQADVGDLIEFDFFPPNHSVVRAEYLFPCIPYELTGRGKVGFFSGFQPVDAILSNPPKWTLLINDTDPIFYYCSAPGACITYGMVGVINPNSSVSLQTQIAYAKNSTYMLEPGDSFPPEGSPITSSSATSTPSSSSTSTTTSATAAPAVTTAPAEKKGLSGGAIAGIAIGSAAVVLLIAGLFFLFGRVRTLDEVLKREAEKSFPPTRKVVLSGSSGLSSIVDNDRNRESQYSHEPGPSRHSHRMEEPPAIGALRSSSPLVRGDTFDEAPAYRHREGASSPTQPARGSVRTESHRSSQTAQGTESVAAGPPPQRAPSGRTLRGPHELYTPMEGEMIDEPPEGSDGAESEKAREAGHD